MFCENLQPETLRPFLNPLLTRLASLLKSPQKVRSSFVRAFVLCVFFELKDSMSPNWVKRDEKVFFITLPCHTTNVDLIYPVRADNSSLFNSSHKRWRWPPSRPQPLLLRLSSCHTQRSVRLAILPLTIFYAYCILCIYAESIFILRYLVMFNNMDVLTYLTRTYPHTICRLYARCSSLSCSTLSPRCTPWGDDLWNVWVT